MSRLVLVTAAALAVVAGMAVPASAREAAPPARPAPTVTVTPDTDLVDQQPVTVAGRHWAYAEEVELFECAVGTGGCSAALDRVWPDDWTFSATYYVRSGFVPDGGGWVDCRVEPCLLRAQELGGSLVAETALSFASGGPAPVPPAISASPDADLLDGQVITVTGTGLRPNDPSLRLLLCSQAQVRRCTTGADVATDASGSFAAPYTVYATNFGRDTIDCRSEPCRIRVAEEYPDLDLSVPVSFRADGPLRYDPTVAVDADTGLLDGQVLTVTGSGWEPGRQVTISECNADRSSCPGYDIVLAADATGSFTTEFRVRAQGDVRRRGEVDCRTEACSLSLDSLRARVVVPLAFDAGAPPLPAPTIDVTPNHDLLPGQEVRVEGTGFFPHQRLAWGQCSRSDYLQPPYCYWGDLTADSSGRVSFTTRVSVSLLQYHSATDCRPDRCYIGIADAYWYPLAIARLHQRPEGDEHVTVRPTTGLHDGDMVAVDANGLNVGFDVEVSQCVFPDPDDPDAARCATDPTTFPVAADGEVHSTLRVQQRIRVEDGDADAWFDCRQVTCWAVVSGPGVTFVPYSIYSDPFEWQGEALSFASATTPVPPAAVTPTFTG